MTEFHLEMRIDNSIPRIRLTTFPRYSGWGDATQVTTTDRQVTVFFDMSADLESLSSGWDADFRYTCISEVDADGKPVLKPEEERSAPAPEGKVTLDLAPGDHYLHVTRTGKMLRDWRSGAAAPGMIIWSKAKVSGYMIIHVE